MTNIEDMGLVINGMSTALSTTMTGIVTYILFRFFLGKLIDVQNNLMFAVERVTTLTIIPAFAPQKQVESVVPQITSLIQNLDTLVQKMATQQQGMTESQRELQETIQDTPRVRSMAEGIQEINENLNKGFRL